MPLQWVKKPSEQTRSEDVQSKISLVRFRFPAPDAGLAGIWSVLAPPDVQLTPKLPGMARSNIEVTLNGALFPGSSKAERIELVVPTATQHVWFSWRSS